MLPEVPKRSAGARPRGRRIITTTLLCMAYLFGLASVAALVPNMIAGTQVVNTNLDAPGPKRLLLSEIAIASFDGIVPDEDGKSYLVTLHLFLNSFGWEYPSAPSKAQTAGLVTPTYDDTLYLPRDFVPIGKELGLDPSAWGCFPPVYTEACENPFFAMFRRQFPWDSPPGVLTKFVYISSFIVAGSLLLSELLIVVRPHWLKCRCYFAVVKRFCPCPRGERHEIERLPPAFWDRYRLWLWPILPAYIAVSVVDLYLRGWMMLSWLNWAPDGDTSGLRPRMGRKFVALNWTAFGCAFAAALCILARLLLSRRENWMEQQGAGPLDESEASVGLGDAAERAGEGSREREEYTDGDVPVVNSETAVSAAK